MNFFHEYHREPRIIHNQKIRFEAHLHYEVEIITLFRGKASLTCAGKEYRIATYLGARAVKIRDGEAVIRQGNKTLTVRRLEDKGKPLAAPVGGDMKRTIRESAACKSCYRYEEKGSVIFEFTSDQAAFEYEYPQ